MDRDNHERLLVEGKNCWRERHARKFSLLVDAAAYFDAFVSAVEQAQHSIYISGWDIDSRVALRREDASSVEEYRLGRFLDRIVSQRKGLHAYILVWDFAMIFAAERELFPVFKLGWCTHKRIHFHMDDAHPLGASHHQKIVVVDDSVAFVGGLDLTKVRWDTPEHKADDPRRVNPDGEPYPPFHDVQVAVSGDAAASLGDLFRIRWARATRQRLEPPRKKASDAWPTGLKADLTDVTVGIARTEPEFDGRPEVREVETLYLDAIASARRFIYMENQYLTSWSIRDALAERLKDENGPEIVIVVPHSSAGWLEERLMDTSRSLLLKALRESDPYGRLAVYYPVLPGIESSKITVHAKVMIVDDDLVRVGSSNLSNRSMGLDTECDAAVEAAEDATIRAAIADMRNRLLAEHLGTTPATVAEKIVAKKSLIGAIEDLRGSERTVERLEAEPPEWIETIGLDYNPADPERPVDPERFLEGMLSEQRGLIGRSDLIKLGAGAFVVLCLAALWRWSPLADWADPAMVASWGTFVRDSPFAPLIVVAAFALGGIVVAPVTVLIVATAIIFSPLLSVVYSLAGCLVSAALVFVAGQYLGRNGVRRLAGERINKISKKIARRGVLAVATARLVPVAPYSVVNLVMGASHVKLRDFLLGTLVGMAPGVIALSFFGESLTRLVTHPDIGNVLMLVAVLVVSVLAIAGISKIVEKTGNSREPKAREVH
jgi:phosphatidylserine/phosphatidylglycerophosphate/cardiolipin synthase-like enzyme/uncharacterized membrane protein YdjX (TVP38/TMEM64 family)